MLYTFSQADYGSAELNRILAGITARDAIVLWQDGVLLPLKHPEFPPCYALDIDIKARNLTNQLQKQSGKIQPISLAELVKLTEQHTPQFAI
ncbi:DsrH/TusB family sulfur metabolism protein [Pasteurellaceae bacterium LIM206]|nr:DsrH/TusB family sulfur metabolism protein [Pasteurellaceae bacterium LIM206]